MALTAWESLEEIRAVFFNTMLNNYTGAAAMAYGTIQSSAGRAGMITEAGKVVLRGTELLPRLTALMTETEKMAGRRNDIAHGIVRKHSHTPTKGRTKVFGYWLVPAGYNARKWRKSDEQFGKEIIEAFETGSWVHAHEYAYTGDDVEVYIKHFINLRDRLRDLALEVTRFCREK